MLQHKQPTMANETQTQAAELAAGLQRLTQQRHSARGPFDLNRPVPAPALAQLLDAARWAPTAHNMQNYQIVVVDDPALITRLSEVKSGLNADFIRENYRQMSFSMAEFLEKKRGVLAEMFPASWRTPAAAEGQVAAGEGRSMRETVQGGPLLLVVLYNAEERAPASEHDALGFISLGCVMENLWLTAESLGLGLQIISAFSSNMVGASVEDEVRKILGFPKHLRIGFTCRIGYSLTKASRFPRVRRDVEDFCHHNAWGHKGLN